ncbi:MAG: hypothetical protein M0Q53_20130 [Prolixibacteraceae bacterium]|jgi:DNA processing protein|nr:hypothetical protein [Prolixibacteraceae bacterium]
MLVSLVPGIGSVTAKSLIAYCGSAGRVFSEKERILRTIPGLGTVLAKNILQSKVLARAEKEVDFTILCMEGYSYDMESNVELNIKCG